MPKGEEKYNTLLTDDLRVVCKSFILQYVSQIVGSDDTNSIHPELLKLCNHGTIAQLLKCRELPSHLINRLNPLDYSVVKFLLLPLHFEPIVYAINSIIFGRVRSANERSVLSQMNLFLRIRPISSTIRINQIADNFNSDSKKAFIFACHFMFHIYPYLSKKHNVSVSLYNPRVLIHLVLFVLESGGYIDETGKVKPAQKALGTNFILPQDSIKLSTTLKAASHAEALTKRLAKGPLLLPFSAYLRRTINGFEIPSDLNYFLNYPAFATDNSLVSLDNNFFDFILNFNDLLNTKRIKADKLYKAIISSDITSKRKVFLGWLAKIRSFGIPNLDLCDISVLTETVIIEDLEKIFYVINSAKNGRINVISPSSIANNLHSFDRRNPASKFL